jgi:hypothetical protein
MICKMSLVGLPDARAILKRLPIIFKPWRWPIKILIISLGDSFLVLPEGLVPDEHIGFFKSLFSFYQSVGGILLALVPGHRLTIVRIKKRLINFHNLLSECLSLWPFDGFLFFKLP